MMVREARDKADALAEGPLLRLGSRWVSLVGAPVIVGLILWTINIIWTMNTQVTTAVTTQTLMQAATSDKIAEMAKRIDQLSTAGYTAIDARRDFSIRDRLIADHERRIQLNADAIQRTGRRIDRIEADALATPHP